MYGVAKKWRQQWWRRGDVANTAKSAKRWRMSVSDKWPSQLMSRRASATSKSSRASLATHGGGRKSALLMAIVSSATYWRNALIGIGGSNPQWPDDGVASALRRH